MELNQYQDKAMSTCMPSSENYVYMAEGLVGEVGEFFSKVAKGIRKKDLYVGDNQLYSVLDEGRSKEFMLELVKELGDVLWFISGLAKIMGVSLEDVATINLEKLASRKVRGVIEGEGDDR